MENSDQIIFASLRSLVTVIATDDNKNLDSHRLPQTFKDLKQWLKK